MCTGLIGEKLREKKKARVQFLFTGNQPVAFL